MMGVETRAYASPAVWKSQPGWDSLMAELKRPAEEGRVTWRETDQAPEGGGRDEGEMRVWHRDRCRRTGGGRSYLLTGRIEEGGRGLPQRHRCGAAPT